MVRVDPGALRSTRPIDLGCAAASWQTVNYKDVVNTLTASMLAGKEISDGLVTRTTSQAIFTDMRVGSDSEGGPVFVESGAVLGISAIDDDKEKRGRWNEVWVVPAERACGVVATAIKTIADATPPLGTRLPLEPAAPPFNWRRAQVQGQRRPCPRRLRHHAATRAGEDTKGRRVARRPTGKAQ